MAQYLELRRRLTRFRHILQVLQIAAAAVAEVYFVLCWLMTGDTVCLLVAIIVPIGTVLGLYSTQRDLRPDEDLRGTVRSLNAKKKRFRKLGIRVRFSSKCFPFAETRRPRWRIIPTTLLMVYGVVATIASPLLLLNASQLPIEHGGGVTASIVFATVLLFASSIGFVTTAVLCWRGKWRWMTLVFVVALAASWFALF